MTTIRMKPFDMRGVKLSAEEGFVLSRVSAPLSFHDLVDMCGLPEERVLAILQRLVAEGTVETDPPLAAAAPPPPQSRVPPPPQSRVPPAPPSRRPPTSAPSRAPGAPSSARVSVAVRAAAPAFHAHTIAVSGVTDVGVVRTNNEDAFRVVDLTTTDVVDTSAQADVDVGPRGLLLLVCDGMGGENAGEVASALAVEVISSHLSSSKEPDAATALRAAVDHANELVVAAADEPGKKGMGTTVIAVLIRDGEAYTAEVGDSRAYVLRGGALTQITKDQTYVQLLLDQGLMTPETIKGSLAKNVVLQALGKAPELIVAQRRLPLRGGDRILVCSDGLSSFVTEVEICDVLRSHESVHAACSKLVAMANERGGKDNITAVMALVGGLLPPQGVNESVAEMLSTLRAYAVGEGDADADHDHDADAP